VAILACFAQLTARSEWLMTLPIGGPEILGKMMAAADALKWTDAPPGKAGPASQPPQALKSGTK
jgi:hypothetical protein